MSNVLSTGFGALALAFSIIGCSSANSPGEPAGEEVGSTQQANTGPHGLCIIVKQSNGTWIEDGECTINIGGGCHSNASSYCQPGRVGSPFTNYCGTETDSHQCMTPW